MPQVLLALGSEAPHSGPGLLPPPPSLWSQEGFLASPQVGGRLAHQHLSWG